MINFLILTFLLFYSIIIFFIYNYNILFIIASFNILISIILKIKIKKHIKYLQSNISFILFIFLCNLPFNNINNTILISFRLLLVIDYTFLMNNYFNPTKLRSAFNIFFKPLKIFKIDTSSMSLAIAISLSLIPILMDEAKEIKYSLKSKGFEPTIKNIIKRPHIYLITFLNNLFDRLIYLERTLIIKSY